MRNYYYIYNKIWMVYCSFAIGILLQFIFYSQVFCCFQPSWIMMLLIHWIIVLPKKVSVGTGFVLGFIMDCIFGVTLGMHALSLSILSYLTIQKIYLFRCVSIWQQSFLLLCFSLINQSIKLLIKFVITRILCSPEVFWSCILDGLLWPCLIFLMRKIYNYQAI